jgi:hypothetical protein
LGLWISWRGPLRARAPAGAVQGLLNAAAASTGARRRKDNPPEEEQAAGSALQQPPAQDYPGAGGAKTAEASGLGAGYFEGHKLGYTDGLNTDPDQGRNRTSRHAT